MEKLPAKRPGDFIDFELPIRRKPAPDQGRQAFGKAAIKQQLAICSGQADKPVQVIDTLDRLRVRFNNCLRGVKMGQGTHYNNSVWRMKQHLS